MYDVPGHKNKKPRHVAENPWNKFLSYKIFGRTNIKCQNGLVLPPAKDFYFNVQALKLPNY
jgi:hypothetical protein